MTAALRRRAVTALAAVLALIVLAMTGRADAHPLGNFSVNHQTRVEASGARLYVRYVLDMAEIPTLRERDAIDAAGGPDAYARTRAGALADEIVVTVDGRAAALVAASARGALLPGAGGLRVFRLEAWYRTTLPPGTTGGGRVSVEDRTYPDRLGWRAVLVRASSGAVLSGSTAPTDDPTNELRRYPASLTSNPSRVDRAAVDWSPGTGAGKVEADVRASPPIAAVDQGGHEAAPGVLGGFFERDLSLGLFLLALLASLGWGALHAVSPGHGKTMVAAYLVGSRGTPRHALMLGLFVTITHTIGVFALGAVVLLLSEYVLPERLYPWLNLASAVMVVLVGVSLVRTRLRGYLAARRVRAAAVGHAGAEGHVHHHDLDHGHGHGHGHGHDHDHGHGHDHDHDHGHGHDHSQGHDHDHGHGHDHGPGGHTHLPSGELSPRRLFAAAAAVGIVPCPSALVIMLGAISLHRVGLGVVLVLAFSVGLAGLLTLLGLLVVYGRDLFGRLPLRRPGVLALPVASALVIVGIGLILVARTVPTIS